MRFTIDKEARRAYLWADTAMDEISLRQIYAHITAPLPNTARYCERQEREGFQTIPAHILWIHLLAGVFQDENCKH